MIIYYLWSSLLSEFGCTQLVASKARGVDCFPNKGSSSLYLVDWAIQDMVGMA